VLPAGTAVVDCPVGAALALPEALLCVVFGELASGCEVTEAPGGDVDTPAVWPEGFAIADAVLVVPDVVDCTMPNDDVIAIGRRIVAVTCPPGIMAGPETVGTNVCGVVEACVIAPAVWTVDLAARGWPLGAEICTRGCSSAV